MTIQLSEKQKQDGWQVVKFGEIAREIKQTTKTALADGLEFYVGLEHLDPQSLRIERKGVIAEDNPSFTRVFKAGHILFGKRRCYQKKAAIADFEGICSGDIIVMEAVGENVLSELVPFIVQSDMFFDWAEKTSSGSLSPRTKWKSLAQFEFTMPPLDRQREVLKLLQKVQENVLKANNLYSSIETVLKVFLSHEFPVKSGSKSPNNIVRRYAKLIQTGPFGSQLHASDYVSDGVRVIMPKDLTRTAEITFESAASIDKITADNLKKHYLKLGDIIFSRRGDVGLFAQYKSPEIPAICGTGCILFRPQEDTNINYLKAMLEAPTTQKWLRDNAVGMTMPNLNTKIISSIPIQDKAEEDIRNISDMYINFWSMRESVSEHYFSIKRVMRRTLCELLGGT